MDDNKCRHGMEGSEGIEHCFVKLLESLEEETVDRGKG